MTRCCRDSMNLKSTGQSCVQQLSVYRSMCSHLRRVLMAKSVVDTRNPRYARSIQRRCRPASCKLRFFDRDFCCPSSETIDKLAYDTEHHPSEIIRVTCRSKSSPKERSCSRERERAASNDANCPCLRPSTAKGHSSSIVKSNMKNQKRPDDCVDCKLQLRTKEFDYDKQRICDAKSDGSPCRSSRSRKWSLHEDATSTAAAVEATTTDNPDGDEQTFRKLAEREEEEALYAKFVYDITQEIVQNGLYTDRELKEVFAKHLERSSARLNKRKLLYEIYQLKISLNMLDDSDEEDEVEADLVYAEKFANFRVPKPPTPPKVLNENKVIEKLQSFKQQENGDQSGMSTPSGRKNVVLVDANAEFLVTERDVLATLADNQVEPEQIQRIYKHLFKKSKDMSLCEAVQVGSEVAYSHRLKQVDRCTSATSLNSTYMRERPQGILRKDCRDFHGKSLSPQTTRRRYSYVLDKRNEALEKCAKWKTCLCDCRTQPCKEHLDLVEKEKTRSLEKIPSKELAVKDKPQKRPSADKKVKVVKQQAKVKKADKIKTEKPIKVVLKKKELKSSEDISEATSSQEATTEEKQDLSSKAQSSSVAQQLAASEAEHEEIEEDIEESVMEEISARKSSRRSSISEDKADEEEKEQASSPEKNNEDELSSITTENEQENEQENENELESAKYSDDFSDVSEDSSDDRTKTSKLSTPKRKLNDKARYASMKDYFDHFTTFDEQKIWRISEGSSSSSSSASLTNERVSTGKSPKNETQQQQEEHSKIIKKRSSSRVVLSNDPWNERLSGLSSDFYTNLQEKYCDPACRKTAKSCSDNCKFVRTNCRNLSRPTDCLNKLQQPVLSTESTSTTS